jgi:hypothetical protein
MSDKLLKTKLRNGMRFLMKVPLGEMIAMKKGLMVWRYGWGRAGAFPALNEFDEVGVGAAQLYAIGCRLSN